MSYSINILEFLKNVNSLYLESEEKSLDLIFETLDLLMSADNFLDIDRIFSCININEINEDIMIGFLVASLPAARKTESRTDFLNDVRKKLLETHSQEEVNRLLKNLG